MAAMHGSVAGRTATILATLALPAALLGCGSDSETQPPPPPLPCVVSDDCADGQLCATAGPATSMSVAEISLEADDKAFCHQMARGFGRSTAPWGAASGGRALAERLCTAQGLSSGSSASADAKRTRQKELLAAAGIRTIRLDLGWSSIEPSKGDFDFSRYDPMIAAAVELDLQVVAILAYGVPWASSLTEDDSKYPPDDPADYADFAAAVANHYKGSVSHYELWNEPNGGYRFFRPNLHGDAGHYADMMAAAAKAIRQACSDCQVYSGGLFYHEQVINGGVEFTHDMLSHRSDAFEGIDRFGFHPYPRYPPSVAPENDSWPERSLAGMVSDLDAVQQLHGLDPLELAVTEVGWPSFGQVDETAQANYLARFVLLGAALGLDPLCWFNVVDGKEHGNFPPEQDFGLYHYGSQDPNGTISPKPSRDALAWLAQIGDDATVKGFHSSPDLHNPTQGRFAVDFDAPAGTWTAIWQLDSSREVTLEGETRSAFDLLGNQLASPSGGSLKLTVDEAPVYLVP